MNRYTIAGIIEDAVQGNVVGVLMPNRGDVPDLLDAATQHPAIKKVVRTYGNEKVEFTSGGRIILFHSVQAVRGYMFDIFVIDDDVLRSSRVRADIVPCLLPDGEMVRL